MRVPRKVLRIIRALEVVDAVEVVIDEGDGDAEDDLKWQ